MAVIKPTKSGGLIVGHGSLLNGVGIVCDVIGATEVPVVDQAACLIGAGAYALAGQPVDAMLSLGSLAPGAGKVADAAKVARLAEKGVVASKTVKTASTAKKAKNLPPAPAKTQAKSATKKNAKEVMEQSDKVAPDSIWSPDQTLPPNAGNNSIFTMKGNNVNPQQINFNNYNYSTNTSPATTGVYNRTPSPLGNTVFRYGY